MQENFRGWILYDASCGFCSWWVPFWAAVLKKRGFEIAPLQSEWVKEKFKGSNDELISDIRLLSSNETKIQGADVYRYVLRYIWWAYPVYLFAILPGTRLIFDWAYRTLADNRYLISRSCGLAGKQKDK